ncbi:MAG TPA: D-alanyl-D-alanine carboxypeptidase family protein [Oscillospiraceae bacterium]|nr:D-alanyl-D-alanine carboxypeptidase family protein [Oscillospiraceae bacterium]
MHIKKNIFGLFIAFAILTGISVNIFADGEVIPAGKEFKPDSRASILMEASTGTVLYENNSSEPLPIGTLNKIMTVLLVSEAIDGGKLSHDTTVTASKYANSMKQAVIWLNVGEKMSVSDLLKGVIIGNANDASIALAEAVAGTEEAFVGMMNSRAKELGMMNTNFKNCTGLDVEGQGSCAYDVALMSRELIKHKDLYGYMTCWMDSLRNGATEIVSTNVLVKSYKGIIGIKAGYTAAAANCLSVAATRDGVTYIAVVLGCADKDSRFTEGKNLLNTGFSNYQVVKPDVPEELSQPLKVKGGVEKEIVPEIQDYRNIVIPNGQFKNVKCEYQINEKIEAPVEDKQIIGEISFFLDDKLIYKSNLISSCEIEKMSITKALSILTKSLFTF